MSKATRGTWRQALTHFCVMIHTAPSVLHRFQDRALERASCPAGYSGDGAHADVRRP
jgi:hypothetical protein